MGSIVLELIPIMDLPTARDYACRLHDVAVDMIRHTADDGFKQIIKLHSILGMTVFIIDAIDTVGVVKCEHLEWLRENSFSPYEDEYTVDGYPILDCIDVMDDDSVIYMVEAHDGTTMLHSRREPGAYQLEYGSPA